MPNSLIKRRTSRTDGQKYSTPVAVRFTEQQDRLLTSLANSNRCSKNEIIRQAVAEYLNKDMSDNEIFHASLNDIKYRLSIIDDKIKKYPAIFYTAVKEMFSLLPERSPIPQGELENRMDAFAREVGRISSRNRNGVFENIIIDCIERNFPEDGDGQ